MDFNKVIEQFGLKIGDKVKVVRHFLDYYPQSLKPYSYHHPSSDKADQMELLTGIFTGVEVWPANKNKWGKNVLLAVVNMGKEIIKPRIDLLVKLDNTEVKI
jgi:hypothetical protein